MSSEVYPSPSALFTFNTVRPRQHGHHFADDIFKCFFLNENVWISIKISLKDLINNVPALVQIMAWRRPGDKPLSEATMVRLPAHICVTRPQWDNICHWSRRSAASLQSSLPSFTKTYPCSDCHQHCCKSICQINPKQLIASRFVDKPPTEGHSSCYNEEFMCCSEWLECLSRSYTEFFSSAPLNFYIIYPIYNTAEEWPANFFSALWI